MNKTISATGRPQAILFTLCLLAYTCAYLSRDTFSAVMPNILSQTEVTKTDLGLVSTIFLIFYGSGQLISGILADKFPAKNLIFIGLITAGIVNFLFGFTNYSYQMMILWGINGFALSLLWAPLIKVLVTYMDDEHIQKALINISISMPVGTLLGFVLSALFIKTATFRTAFIFNGLVILVMAGFWFIITKKILPKLQVQVRSNQKAQANHPSRLMKLFLVSGMIFIIGATMCNGVIRNGVSIWVPTYLTENFKLEEYISVLTATLIPIINLSGIYVGGYLNKKTNNEMITSALLFILAAISMGILIFIGNVSPFIAIIFLGITTASMQGLNSIIMGLVPYHFEKHGKAATTTGCLNASAYLASSIGSYGVGIISSIYGWNMTILSWIIIAVLGTSFTLFVARVWSNFKNNKA